jgi:hypothetical protein
MRVRMVQQMSGTRPDGTPWPGAGEEFDASGEEFEWLTHTADSQSSPIAVPVTEKRGSEQAETRPAPEDPKVETREDDTAEDASEDDDVPPAKRGPGRPRKDSLPK